MHTVKNLNTNNIWLNKIELGSAQFGLNYGVNNGKKVSKEEANKIHKFLLNKGSYLIDTAPSYGDSESVVEDIIKKDTRVVTKLLPMSKHTPDEIIKGIESSHSKYGSKLYGLILHDSNDLFDSKFKSVIDYLNGIRGCAIKVGASVYNPLDLMRIYDVLEIDMIQMPFNILDQRASDSTLINLITKQNIEVHVRSIFLQGLLLMGGNIPLSLESVMPYLKSVENFAKNRGLSVYELCILYVFKQSWVKHVVIGLDNLIQAEILISTVIKMSKVDSNSNIDFKELACTDMNLINPAKWVHD